MSEAIDIRLRRARSWVRKASKDTLQNDLDAQFIFLWIAFNALYGLPRYRDDVTTPQAWPKEINDFNKFLCEVEKLSHGSIETALRPFTADIERIMQSPFLNNACWRQWDREGIRDRQKRVTTARNVYAQGIHLDQLLARIYTLRN